MKNKLSTNLQRRGRRTSCGQHEHASKREAIRCGKLQALHAVGEIIDLKQQPEYDLCGVMYRADFEYEERDAAGHWTLIVEDCKGFRTPVYRLKKRLMKNIHGIEIRET